MSKIEVFTPTRATSQEDLERIYDILQREPNIMGFVYKATIQESIYGNTNRLNLVAARLDGEIVGALMVVGRRPYQHLWKSGNVYVLPEARRQRVGTALYTAAAIGAIIEGRRLTQDDVILDYSPWMVRERKPTDVCGGGKGFLITLGYQQAGTFPRVTTGFKTIEPWIKEVIPYIEDYIIRIPKGTTIQLFHTATAQKVYEENLKRYQTYDPDLAKTLVFKREGVLQGLWEGVEVIAL